MKRILVPVDFSHSSSNALRYAGEIAHKSGAEVFALHVYQGDKPLKTTVIVTEEKLLRFTMHALRNFPGLKLKVKYSFHVTLQPPNRGKGGTKFIKGILSSGLLAEMDLVVMGTKGASGLKEVFIGSNTFDLAQKIDKPIIAVPENGYFNGLQRILFCSDFNNHENINCLYPLKKLAMLFSSDVRICHVRKKGKKHPSGGDMNESVDEDNFFGKEVEHSFKIISSDNILKGINDYLQYKSDIDMVAVVNHKRSTMNSLFRTDHTRKLAFHAKMPVLILNEKV